jgi:1-acyl-sn-glycerol-3-phosphate acyltransferase
MAARLDVADLKMNTADNARVAESALSRKLLIQAGQRVLILNAPPGYLEDLRPLPEGAVADEQANGPNDVVQLFARDRAQLERDAGAALGALKPGGVLWMAYPNPKQGPVADLSRDHGWGVLHAAGLVAVTQVSLSDDWNSLRWRPNAEAAAAGRTSGAVPPADLLPVGRRATLTYRLVRLVTIPALRLAFRFDVHGREHIPRKGTYIVIANHLGWLDAMTVLMVFPIEPRIHLLADPTGMMRRKLEWALVRATGGIIPVERAVRDPQVLFRHVGRCFSLGGALALFPEGDFGPREGELLPFKKGFAHFAAGGGIPVVPVGLSGPKDVWLGKRIGVYIGEPIPTAGKTVDEIHRLGAEAVARLLPPYHEPPGPKPLRRWLTGLF